MLLMTSRRTFALSAVFIALSQTAFATTEDDLAEINVSSSADATATEHSKSFTTSAMKTTTGLELSPKETPQSVSVITKQQLQDRGINKMEDALKTTTGVSVVRDSGKHRFYSRGFLIDQMEVDGLPTTVAGGANGNPYRDSSSMADLLIYDHLEVVRGATGLTQSNGEPGGTINAVRKKPTSNFQAKGNFTFNNWGKAYTNVDVSGPLNNSGSLRGRFIAALEHDPTFKNINKADSNRLLYGVIESNLGDNTVASVGMMYQNRHETPDYFGVPLHENSFSSPFKYDTYLGYNWARRKIRQFNLFSETNTFLNDNWQWSNRFSYTRSNSTDKVGAITNLSTNYKGLAQGGSLATNNLQNYLNHGDEFVYRTGLTGKFDWLGQQQDVFLNYTYSYEKENTMWRRVRNSTAFDPFSFNGAEIAEPDWNNVTDSVNKRDRTHYRNRIISNALSAGIRFSPTEKWHILAGARATQWRNISETNYDIWNSAVDSDADSYTITKRNRIVPYVGITYDIDKNHSLYASYTSIFKPQSVKDYNSKTLAPITGTNYEVGLKGSYYDGRLNTSLALFDVRQKNRPVYSSGLNAKGTQGYYIPMGEVESKGFELEVSGNLTPDWSLFAGYTYNKSKYKQSESSRYLAGSNYSSYTPKHLFRLYSSYNLPFDNKKWTIGGGVNFQSRVTSLYNVQQASYAVWDANLQYQVSPHISLRFSVLNLTDKRYFENQKARVYGGNNFYAEPRTYSFMLDWQF
ncbi:TonB-dependent siderophore receptor [Aggregatibacter aphrophilus]|uniref:TonB-dependent siderophore receptor n=1 Tax=Aggregatibacter aphrophilus TaxID=732 RepID=UPI0028E3B134|nr:TonB-dependent siderophore receptor [Aggregatibacter aphrophilus]